MEEAGPHVRTLAKRRGEVSVGLHLGVNNDTECEGR